MLDSKLLNILDFNLVLERLAVFAVSEKSKTEIKKLMPSNDLADVKKMQQLTSEAYKVIYKYNLNPIIQFDNVDEILNKAKAGATLQMGELLKVARLIRSARIAKKDINGTGDDVIILRELVSSIFVDSELEKMIGDSIASESEMRDDASDALKMLRRKILVINGRLKDKLASYTRNNDVSKFLQDNLVTVRMGRFVLPVKSECRSSIPGLIHDQSASGATVFIEPFAIVELNNELKFLQLEEAREVERILANMSERVSSGYATLVMCEMQCTMLDIVFAKCNYSISYHGTEPILNNRGYVNLVNARHPLIKVEKIVPVNIKVGKDYKLLIITGPNTGGKTVCLKTMGLCCLMAELGLWLPCEENSEISIFDSVYCDLGDDQSIEQSLSTFSAHIVNIVRITEKITPHSLVLMDELGAGTDPIEGAALSVGIVKYLELIGAVGIITTHFSELKEYALVSKNLMNACMQFDEVTLKPTFKLVIGLPGVSNALKIAGTLGLNDFILSRATECLTKEKIEFEEILANAEKTKFQALRESEENKLCKQKLEQDRLQLENERYKLQEKLDKINNNAKAETKRVINNMLEQADEIMEEMKEKIKAADEESMREARQLRHKLEDIKHFNDDAPSPIYDEVDTSNLKIGMVIIVKSLRAEGKLMSLPDRKGLVHVLIGSLSTVVKISDLAKPIHVEKKKTSRTLPNVKSNNNESNNKEQLTQEIKVLGLTVAEAIEYLDPYILSAGSNKIMRIVHGKGTGALGKGIQNYLRNNSLVASFRYGRYGEGDNGVTIVELK